MSSDVVTRVLAFSKKADELADNGHILRAAENYGRAAETARALGEDNLMTLCMRLRKANMLLFYASRPLDAADSDSDLCATAPHRAEFMALLSGAVEALERRRVAGTLLQGKCTAAEETWSAKELMRNVSSLTAAQAASFAALAGYEEFLYAAKSSLNVLGHASFFEGECSDAQLQSFVHHVVHAAELMQQPRCHSGEVSLQAEVAFADTFRAVLALSSEGDGMGLDANRLQLLAGAWQRLERSGVLQERHIERLTWSLELEGHAFRAAIHASLNAPGLRSCALPGCGAREAHPAHFKSCAACRTVVYCCREHQVAGWPGHKKACKTARKAQEEEDEGGASGT